MGKKIYTRESALAAAKPNIQKIDGNKIWVKGPCSLRSLGALDYLEFQCNFVVDYEVPTKEE